MAERVFKDPPVFLTTTELSERLRLNPGTLAQQRWRGVPPGSLGVRVGNRVLYDWELVAKWIAEQRAEQRRT